MEELLVVLAVMTMVMVGMMLLQGKKGNDEQQRKRACNRESRHALRIHTYDARGEVLHRCRCGLHFRRGMEGDWCRICADPQLERQALRTFLRRRA